MSRIAFFLKNDTGSTSIEYGMIALGIFVGIVAGLNLVGFQLRTTVWSISTQFEKNSFLVVE
jgi:Flp pilus assembly pilin Flp